MKTCRHCNKDRGTYPRGLCWNCYYRPEVRSQFSLLKKSTTLVTNSAKKLPEPTIAAPGSKEKIAILIKRAEAGEMLWHPLDAK